jgi:hypothetical protein
MPCQEINPHLHTDGLLGSSPFNEAEALQNLCSSWTEAQIKAILAEVLGDTIQADTSWEEARPEILIRLSYALHDDRSPEGKKIEALLYDIQDRENYLNPSAPSIPFSYYRGEAPSVTLTIEPEQEPSIQPLPNTIAVCIDRNVKKPELERHAHALAQNTPQLTQLSLRPGLFGFNRADGEPYALFQRHVQALTQKDPQLAALYRQVGHFGFHRETGESYDLFLRTLLKTGCVPQDIDFDSTGFYHQRTLAELSYQQQAKYGSDFRIYSRIPESLSILMDVKRRYFEVGEVFLSSPIDLVRAARLLLIFELSTLQLKPDLPLFQKVCSGELLDNLLSQADRDWADTLKTQSVSSLFHC